MGKDCQIGFVTLSSSPFLNMREVNIDPRGVEEEVLFLQVLLVFIVFASLNTPIEKGRMLLHGQSQMKERHLRKLPGKLELSPLEFNS